MLEKVMSPLTRGDDRGMVVRYARKEANTRENTIAKLTTLTRKEASSVYESGSEVNSWLHFDSVPSTVYHELQ